MAIIFVILLLLGILKEVILKMVIADSKIGKFVYGIRIAINIIMGIFLLIAIIKSYISEDK